ncbi:MAG TPA: hypothetical protein VN047_05875 [Sphingopyxis sp.]|uniref:hypothetical protein n=1 Tax=Sphingopyxis sp. TaxID=1908224 RepID=UPI002BA3416A|nr:hypothetical protein [Sphingopyxis sp.]HWW56400.1 hypothetical protein [Sphingopyxis sp.]
MLIMIHNPAPSSAPSDMPALPSHNDATPFSSIPDSLLPAFGSYGIDVAAPQDVGPVTDGQHSISEGI